MSTSPPSPATSELGRAEAEHLGVAEPADRPARTAPRGRGAASKITGMPCAVAELLERSTVARRAEHVGGEDRRRAVEPRRRRRRRRSGTSSGRTPRSGRSPFHATAWADAEKVKLGSRTWTVRPPRAEAP